MSDLQVVEPGAELDRPGQLTEVPARPRRPS